MVCGQSTLLCAGMGGHPIPFSNRPSDSRAGGGFCTERAPPESPTAAQPNLANNLIVRVAPRSLRYRRRPNPLRSGSASIGVGYFDEGESR
jgi:hypothetical protein